MVGPNGSGKSNVIDAMLFVFGKRAKQVGSSFVRAHITTLAVEYVLKCKEWRFSLRTI